MAYDHSGQKIHYAIMRHKKLKGSSHLTTVTQHNMRLRETPNADSSAPAPNDLIGSGSVLDDVKACMTRHGVKGVRSKGVWAIEIVCTLSEGFIEASPPGTLQAWTDASIQWARKKYGSDRVTNAFVHDDEKENHLHIVAVPLVWKTIERLHDVGARRPEWRLTARDSIGGSKKQLAMEQDDYAQAVQHLGLVRGRSSLITKSVNKPLKQYYEEMAQAQEALESELSALRDRHAAFEAREEDLVRRERAAEASLKSDREKAEVELAETNRRTLALEYCLAAWARGELLATMTPAGTRLGVAPGKGEPGLAAELEHCRSIVEPFVERVSGGIKHLIAKQVASQVESAARAAVTPGMIIAAANAMVTVDDVEVALAGKLDARRASQLAFARNQQSRGPGI